MTLLQDKQNAAIVRTTLQLAHNMNLEVVAEGVEDDATLDYLSNAGCEQAQGYVLSRPVSSDDLLAWLSTRVDTPRRERRGAKRVFRQKS